MKLRFLLAVLLILLVPLFGSKVFAQVNYKLDTNKDVPQDFHTYTQSVFIEIGSAISCQLSGIDPTNPNGKCLGIDPDTHKIGYVTNGGGLIGITGNLISMTFDIPVSSTQYMQDVAGNFGIAKKAYAQENNGIGFNGLKFLLPLWKTFRNIVYIFFVFIFVIIGLGIMFRVKIDPRTVMTIQNQIPKIIIAIVLVTLSYAIAGFLIDMMYVFMYLIFNIFAPHINNIGGLNPIDLQGSNPLGAVGALGGTKIAFQAASGIGGIIASLFDNTTGKIIATIVSGILGAGAGSIGMIGFGTVIGGVLGATGGLLFGSKIFGIIGGLVAFLVISAALLTALFRLWFQLLKAYVSLLINIVLAPFWIAAGLFPNSSMSFSTWIRDLIGNLAPFPATLVLLLFGKVFIENFGQSNAKNYFVPPFIGNPGDPNAFGALIGLGIILLSPNVVNLVRQAIKAPQGKMFDGIKTSLGVGASIAGAPAAGVGKRLWGTDPYTKQPRILQKGVTDRLGQLTAKDYGGSLLGKTLGRAMGIPYAGMKLLGGAKDASGGTYEAPAVREKRERGQIINATRDLQALRATRTKNQDTERTSPDEINKVREAQKKIRDMGLRGDNAAIGHDIIDKLALHNQKDADILANITRANNIIGSTTATDDEINSAKRTKELNEDEKKTRGL
ncbi:MAG TPA: hypothetical protein VHE53_03200 [Patescibacteria group bacterium]|nr:hypothetical protein [Patescibacteria group bacterium]